MTTTNPLTEGPHTRLKRERERGGGGGGGGGSKVRVKSSRQLRILFS